MAIYGIIYRAVHRDTGMVYIGQTKRALALRMREHRWLRHSRSFFDRMVRRYGLEAFDFETVDSADSPRELNLKEKQWITNLNCLSPNGFNQKLAGFREKPCSGYRLSPETRAKLSQHAANRSIEHRLRLAESQRGKTRSNETRQKISAALSGRKLSEETLAKRRGVPRSPETRAKIAAFQSGRERSAVTRANMSAAQRALQKTIPESQRQRLRELNLGKKQSEATRAKRSASIAAYWAQRRGISVVSG